jgi:hypothetical protein
MRKFIASIASVLVFALPAAADSAPPPPKQTQAEEPSPPAPCGDAPCEKPKCPQTIDCMPGGGKERAELCAWVKKNCPETEILQ